MGALPGCVSRSTFLVVLGAVFGGIAVLLISLGIAFEPLLLFVSIPFAAAGYMIWYHGTGRLEERMRQRAARERARERARMGDGGPKAENGPRWADSEFRGRRERRRRVFEGAGRSGRGAGTDRAPTGDTGMGVERAYRVLGLDPGSDAEAVRSAYRSKVKEVHPDTDDGDEESFKRVNEAYETLQERVL